MNVHFTHSIVARITVAFSSLAGSLFQLMTPPLVPLPSTNLCEPSDRVPGHYTLHVTRCALLLHRQTLRRVHTGLCALLLVSTSQLTWLDGDGNPVTAGVELSTQLNADGKRANHDHDGKGKLVGGETAAKHEPTTCSLASTYRRAHILTRILARPLVRVLMWSYITTAASR